MSCKLIIKDEVNIKLEGLPVEVRRKISNSLKFELPYARHMPQFKLGRWDGTTTFFGIGGNGYLNHLETIIPILESSGIDIAEIVDNRQPYNFALRPITETYWADQGKVWPERHPLEGQPIMLRDYQVEAINNYVTNLQSIQEISTGGGKTILSATLSSLCEPYGRTMVIVPNKSLVVQTEEDYINVGLDVGVYFGDRKELGHQHTIVTWQSLAALDKKDLDDEALSLAEFIDGVVCVMVDECHSAKGQVLQKLLSHNFCNAPIRWGFTGTVPKEAINFHQLFSVLGPVVGQVAAHELQDKGVLSTCHVHVKQLMDTQVYKTYQEELKYLTTDKHRVQYIAAMCEEIRQSGNTVILIDRIETGKMLASLIPNSRFISGDVKLADRKEMYTEIHYNDNEVLIATYGTSAVGINIPRIFNLVLFEPGKSFVRVIQSIGRGIRKAADKDHVNIYDITSACKFARKHLTTRKKFYTEAKYPFSLEKVYWQK